MKSFALAALVAVVSADKDFDCSGGPATATDLAVGNAAPADWAACKTECDTAIAAVEVKTHHYCCQAVDTAAVAADATADPPVVERAASVACTLKQQANTEAAKVEFKTPLVAKAAADGVTYYAWTWNAGTLVADPAAADEKKDAATRVAATLLAAAAFAMY